MKTQTVALADLLAQGLQPEWGENRALILIVDEDPVIADTIADMLQNSGFCAMAAYGAWAAFDFASIVPPDLMIIDVRLPDLRGLELAMIMEKGYPHCRVLLLADRGAAAEIEKLNREGHRFPILMKTKNSKDLLFALAGAGDVPGRRQDWDS